MGVLRLRGGRVAAVCVIVSACIVLETTGYKMFQKKLPNGANVPGVEAVGHEQANGGPNNNFGMDFIEAAFVWTKAFCEKDSDGDGQTNGQEMGDPCCEFEHRKNEKVRWTEGVSHPGDPLLMADPTLWEGITCGEEVAKGEPETTEVVKVKPEGTKAVPVKEKTVMDEVLLGRPEVQNEKRLTAVAPTLHTSVMMSAVALTVMVVYVGVVKSRRRSSNNLPIFRQQRK